MKPRSDESPPDSPEYLEVWARDLVATVRNDEVTQIIADYLAIADDPKVSKHGREIASNRAKMLKRFV